MVNANAIIQLIGYVESESAHTSIEQGQFSGWKKSGNTSLPTVSNAADGVREEIYEAIQSLLPFPYIGHSRPDLKARPLRF